jgi:hypothetical protein
MATNNEPPPEPSNTISPSRRGSIMAGDCCFSAKVRPSLNGLPKERDWKKKTNQCELLRKYLSVQEIKQILRCNCRECTSDGEGDTTKRSKKYCESLSKHIFDCALRAFAVCIVAGHPNAIYHLTKCTDRLFPIWCEDGTLDRMLPDDVVANIKSNRSTFFDPSPTKEPPSRMNFAEGERKNFHDHLRQPGVGGGDDLWMDLARWTHHFAENGHPEDFEWMNKLCFTDNHQGHISSDAKIVWNLGNVLLDVLEFLVGGSADVKKLDQARSGLSAQDWISSNERRFRYDGGGESAKDRAKSIRLCFGFHLARNMLDPSPSRRPDRSRVHDRVAELVRPDLVENLENYCIASPKDDGYGLVKFRFM